MRSISRREIIEGGAAATFAGHAIATRGGDVSLVALMAVLDRLDERINAQSDACDVLWKADRLAGAGEGPLFGAMSDRLEAMHAQKSKISNAIVNTPSTSFVGVAHKLALWRREAVIARDYDFDGAHESFTFSAYRDVLRLTGLESLAHRNDRRTAALMRNYWSG